MDDDFPLFSALSSLQCFDAVGWMIMTGRASGLYKTCAVYPQGSSSEKLEKEIKRAVG